MESLFAISIAPGFNWIHPITTKKSVLTEFMASNRASINLDEEIKVKRRRTDYLITTPEVSFIVTSMSMKLAINELKQN
jgi:hypothetical protein